MRPIAWIFDLDETLVASAGFWRDAIDSVAARLGGRLDPAIWAACKGRNVFGLGELLRDCIDPSADAVATGLAIREALLGNWRAGVVLPMPGIPGLLDRIGAHVPLAVASGSPADAIAIALDRLGWTGRFGAAVSTEEVPRGKPHPDVFLEAARRLGVDPAVCVVAEDSPAGARAALAAGMRCVVVPSVPPAEFAGQDVTLLDGWDDWPPPRTRADVP